MKIIHTRLVRDACAAVAALALSVSACSSSSDGASSGSTGEPSGAGADVGSQGPGTPSDEADAGSSTGGAVGDPDVVVEPPPPAFEATFTAEGSAASGAWIRTEVQPIDTTHVAIEVHASDLDDVFGVAFRLRWDPTLLRWTGGKAEDVLAANGSTGVTSLLEREPGELVYGHALFPNATKNFMSPVELQGVPIPDAVLLRVELEVLAAGETTLDFVLDSRDVRSPDGEQIPLTWSAGTVKLVEIERGAR